MSWNNIIETTEKRFINEHKIGTKSLDPIPSERLAVEVINDILRRSGIDVIDDVEAGQRVLDMVNGNARLMGTRVKNRMEEVFESFKDKRLTDNVRTIVDVFSGKLDKETISFKNTDGNEYKMIFIQGNENMAGTKHSLYRHFRTKDGWFDVEDIQKVEKILRLGKRMEDGKKVTYFFKSQGNGVRYAIIARKEGGKERFISFYTNRKAPKKSLQNALGKTQNTLSGAQEVLDANSYAKIDNISESDNSEHNLFRSETKDIDKIREQRVFHGSGAEFTKFDHKYMGTGEGVQAYGWGTYVTEVEGIAKTYAEKYVSDKIGNKLSYLYTALNENESSIDIIQKSIDEQPEEMQQIKETLAMCKEDLSRYEEYRNDIVVKHGKESIEYKNFEFIEGEIIQEIKKKIEYLENRIIEEGEASIARSDVLEAAKIENQRLRGEIDKIESQFSRYLYTVETPEDTGRNYLTWEKGIGDESIERLRSYLSENYRTKTLKSFDEYIGYNENNSADVHDWLTSGEKVYNQFSLLVGGAKEASMILHNLGFVGISYPADYRRGGSAGGARNYVIFNEEDAKMTERIRFFRTPLGNAYGFTIGGKIYIDPSIATLETPIHEYTHLWAEVLRRQNPKEWENIVGLMKNTTIWDDVKAIYPELEKDSDVAEEVLAHYSGHRGAERLKEALKREMGVEGLSIADKNKIISVFISVKDTIERFWRDVSKILGKRFISAKHISDTVLYDMLRGYNPIKDLDKKEAGRQGLKYGL